MPRRIVGLFLFRISCRGGFLGCPKQWWMFFVMQESCSLLSLLPALNPSVPAVSLALFNPHSPAEHRCVSPFSSLWKKHKTKKPFVIRDLFLEEKYLCLRLCVVGCVVIEFLLYNIAFAFVHVVSECECFLIVHLPVCGFLETLKTLGKPTAIPLTKPASLLALQQPSVLDQPSKQHNRTFYLV